MALYEHRDVVDTPAARTPPVSRRSRVRCRVSPSGAVPVTMMVSA